MSSNNIPTDLKYTLSHEWVKVEHDGIAIVGITDHAQSALGDIVFVELPEVGRTLEEGAPCGVIESVKAASDIYAPVAGEVLAVNHDLAQDPGAINQAPYQHWLFKIQPTEAIFDNLMNAADYATEVANS